MRIELLDPKWKEQQQRALAGQATSQFATDEQIAENLGKLGRNRPDIFGGDELDARRKKQQEADKAAARVIWDGHTGSVQEVQQKALDQSREDQQRARAAPPRGPETPTIGPAAPSAVRRAPLPPALRPSMVPSATEASAAAAKALEAAAMFAAPPAGPARPLPAGGPPGGGVVHHHMPMSMPPPPPPGAGFGGMMMMPPPPPGALGGMGMMMPPPPQMRPPCVLCRRARVCV